jgi:hypothetical protein
MKAEFISVQTAATGTNWTALGGADSADTRFNRVHVINNTGTTLLFRRNGAGVEFELPQGLTWSFAIVHLANLEVKRADESNTRVTIYAEAELI